MLEVVSPISFIPCTVNMDIDSEAVSFIINPVSFIDVSIYMYEFPMTMSPVILPLAFVASTIRPDLSTEPISEPSYPLTSVSCSSLKGVKRSFFSLSRRVVFLISRDCLFRLINSKVLAVSL
jgi:hypothetical protein